MSIRSHSALVNALDPSSCAAAAEGPKTKMDCARNVSASPSTSGASGPIDHKTYLLAATEGDDSTVVLDVQRHMLSQRAGSAIARRNEKPVAMWRLRDFPGQRVFAATRADEENVHATP